MSGTNYGEARKADLELLLQEYRKQMDKYTSAIKSSNTSKAATAAGEIQNVLNQLTDNNNETSGFINNEINTIRGDSEDYNKNVHQTRGLKKLLKERENETSFNQYRLKQDIEADRWINRKIMFFRLVILGLIILLVVFLFRLKKKSSPASTPSPESSPAAI